MKIGIISEGHADRAVITNILVGVLGIDINDIEPLRPIYNVDETDKANVNPLTFSSWTVVKTECEQKELIEGFLAIEGQDFVVIHIDSAEAELYGLTRPSRAMKNYSEVLRNLVIDKIDNWISNVGISNQILYAVAIEEIDAWILTIFEKKDSSIIPNPKLRLGRILSKQGINSTSNYDNYFALSKSLSKTKIIEKEKLLSYNFSLCAFYEEVKTKVLPKI